MKIKMELQNEFTYKYYKHGSLFSTFILKIKTKYFSTYFKQLQTAENWISKTTNNTKIFLVQLFIDLQNTY